MKTLYLHIGRGKTGTSSIQRFLALNTAALQELGVHYFQFDGGSLGLGHPNFAKFFIPSFPAYMDPISNPEGMLGDLMSELECSKSASFLFSAENFELADPNLLKEFLQEKFEALRVKIIYFVRSQDELAESEYNQMVKLKREKRSFTEYINDSLDGFNFFEVAERWESCFGEGSVHCRVIDRRKPNAIGQFLDCLQLPDFKSEHESLAGSVERRSNAAIGYNALSVARILNAVEVEQRPVLYEQIFAALQKDDFPALFFTAKEAESFRERYHESNRAFSQRFLDEVCDDLGGRLYADDERDEICRRIEAGKHKR